jgi:hypothetical protein
MSAPFWNFDDDIPAGPKEGPTFQLGGEEFRCVPVPPGGAVLRLVSAIGRDERGRQVYNLPDINAFIEDCLLEEHVVTQLSQPTDEQGDPDGNADPIEVVVTEATDDLARWRVLMGDKKRPIPIKTLGDVLMRLQEHYTERPTERSGR